MSQTSFPSGRPQPGEAGAYYFGYIDQVPGEDALAVLEAQAHETPGFLGSVSEKRSLHRYAPDKWSVREMWSHVTDTERVFLSRAFWFARGFESPLPSFDQNVSTAAARADDRSWASHIREFGAVREATLAFFRGLPGDAWMRRGIASDNPFTVRAIAFIVAGHAIHHETLLRERYLASRSAG
jgi:hypothetical protein